MSPTLPVVQAIVLADQIYTDKESGKKIIAGTFNRLFASEFPRKFSRTTNLYVNLTNLRSKHDLVMMWVDLKDEGKILMRSPTITVESKEGNPFANLELVVEIPPFPMPHPGIYAFELHSNDTRIGSIRVTVDEVKAPPIADAGDET